MADVVVTQQDIYDLLLEVKDTVTTVQVEQRVDSTMVRDHETRIREIEARENLTQRVVELSAAVERLKVRVYAIPSASVLLAMAALVYTFVRTQGGT